MRRLSVLAVSAWLLTGCAQAATKAEPVGPGDLASLRAADSAWMQASVSRNADRMMAFYAPSAIADLGPSEPARGAPSIREMWTEIYADTVYRLDWVNQRAEILPGTRLGYTIGTWRQHTATSDSTGPYFAVWEKQADGKWLVLLDTAR